MEKTIYIRSHELVFTDSSCKLVTTLEEQGELVELFYEVEKEYAPYLVSETADAILYLILQYALRTGLTIRSDVPMSTSFMYNMKEVLIPSLLLGDKSLHNIDIDVPLIDIDFHGNAVGTAVTCGIDSFYTIMKHHSLPYSNMNLTHLFIASSSIDLWKSECSNIHEYKKHFDYLFNRYEGIAKELNLPLVVGYSNYLEYLYNPKRVKKGITVHQYVTMANVISLRKLWRVYYFSSSEPFTIFDLIDNSTKATSRHELLSMHVLSLPGFNCYSTGGSVSREEKTIALTNYPVAQNYLHPCFWTKHQVNCTKPSCSKCVRALLTLDVHDKLESFNKVFDINKYKKNRLSFFIRACELKEDEYIEPIYRKLLKKYPKIMATAEVTAKEKIARQLYWRSLRLNIIPKIPKNLIFGSNTGRQFYKVFIDGISPKFNYKLTYGNDNLLIGLYCDDENFIKKCDTLFSHESDTITLNKDTVIPKTNSVQGVIDFIASTRKQIEKLHDVQDFEFISPDSRKIYARL